MKSLFFLAMFLLAFIFVKAENQLPLVKDGKSDYRIVISAKAGENEHRSADFLQTYLFKISGCNLPIVTDDTKKAKHEILVGKTNRQKEKELNKLLTGLAPDGYILRTQKGKLYILGGSHKGAIYGTISLLEKYMGCRKYSPAVESVPQQSSINLPEINIKDEPVNTFRVINGEFLKDKDYKDWQRLDDVDDVFAKGYYVHTFDRLVPRAQYFESHPEYYSMMNGKRIHDQLCLSNPEVLRLTIERLKQEMEKQPDKVFWSVSQNDNFSYCQCPECSKIIAEEGTPAGPIIRFVNQVAAHFPDKIISTLAYEYSRQAPKITKPASNVQIMLCTIELSRSKPIEEDPSSRSFLKDIEDWGKISNHIYLWDYTVNFSHHISPFPNQHTLQPNIQFFSKNGAHEHFQQSNTDIGHEFSELKSYLISRLLWNPNVNADSVKNEFLTGYYQAAAPFIRNYIDRLESEIISSGEGLDIYGSPVGHASTFLSEKNTQYYTECFNNAENAVKDDLQLLQRVKTARLPLEYALMEIGKNDMFGPRGWYTESNGKFILRQDMRNMLEDFNTTCIKNGVKSVNEAGLTPADYYKATLRFIDVQVDDNLAFRKKVTASPMPNPRYSNGDPSVLTNGVQGASDYKVHWLGWENTDFELTLDLEKVCTPKEILIGSLYDPKSWILHPHKVTCQVSIDGKTYRDAGTVEIEGNQQKEDVTHSFRFDQNLGKVRFVKFKVEGTHTLPSWHPSEGGLSWVFLDEIVVR